VHYIWWVEKKAAWVNPLRHACWRSIWLIIISPLLGLIQIVRTVRFHASIPILSAPFQCFDSLDAIIEAAEQNPSGNIIVDLAAQTAAPMYEWINSCDFLGLMAEFGVKVYLWHVMDDGADSMNLLTKVMDTFRGKNIKIIAVQNQGRGNNYKNFEESAVYTRAKTHGVEMLTLARLHDSLAQKIDFNNFSFWAAANSRDFMSVIDRRRVGVWLKHAYSQIEQGLAGSSSQQSSTPLAQARNGQTAPSVHSLQVQRVSEAEC